MLKIRTLLFATDFSPYSANAFSLAAALARDYKARLLIVHVREAPVMPVGEFGYLPPEGEDLDKARRQLMAIKPSDTAIEVEHILVDGTPAFEIMRVAEEKDCDLIVLGSHGRTGLERLLIGSVAERVVRSSNCPVFVYKQPMARGAKEKTTAQAQPAAV